MALPDVNALVALVDSEHVHHAPATRWFRQSQSAGWATCPLTENGMVRVLSQAAYPTGRRTPAQVIEILSALKAAFGQSHVFWNDDLSLTDSTVFDATFITSPGLITDAYLLGVASQHSAKLVSFDRTLPWRAIRGASKDLVELLA